MENEKRNRAKERIWGEEGFQPEMLRFPNCQCFGCVHADEDLIGDDGKVILTGYDGSVCAVYDGNPESKSLEILRGEVDCPHRKTE